MAMPILAFTMPPAVGPVIVPAVPMPVIAASVITVSTITAPTMAGATVAAPVVAAALAAGMRITVRAGSAATVWRRIGALDGRLPVARRLPLFLSVVDIGNPIAPSVMLDAPVALTAALTVVPLRVLVALAVRGRPGRYGQCGDQ